VIEHFRATFQLDPSILHNSVREQNTNVQVRKEPKEVQRERQLEAAAANAAQRAKQRESADKKTRMKVQHQLRASAAALCGSASVLQPLA
jgi:hypothetical protein